MTYETGLSSFEIISDFQYRERVDFKCKRISRRFHNPQGLGLRS